MVNANRPLAFITDDDLLDDLLKLAAAAGCDLELVPDAAAARQLWMSAPMIVLDATGAAQCAEAELTRREGIVLVAPDPPPEEVWMRGVAIGAEHVLGLPGAEPWLVSALADAVEAPASTSGKVLAVLGGRGGAGASVFTVAVGLTALAVGRDTLLVDCDPKGGGLDLVLGAETEDGLRWPDMRLKGGRVAASSLHTALPTRVQGSARLTMLSGARKNVGPAPDAVSAVVEAGRRAGEVVVCDVPRELGPAACAALDRADLTVIVLPSEVRACVMARLLAERLAEHAVAPQAIVRGPAPGGLTAEEVAAAADLPLLTAMRPEPQLAQSLERGNFHPRPRGPLAVAARSTLDALAAQPVCYRTGRELKAAS